MKWGVRRYQNPDGALTKAGQKRYNKAQKRVEKLGKKIVDELDRDVDPNESIFKNKEFWKKKKGSSAIPYADPFFFFVLFM